MDPVPGASVTVVLSPDDDRARIVNGELVDRSAQIMSIELDDDVDVAVTPGEAVVVVVHGDPPEVLLAIGTAPDGPSERFRLRLVERRS